MPTGDVSRVNGWRMLIIPKMLTGVDPSAYTTGLIHRGIVRGCSLIKLGLIPSYMQYFCISAMTIMNREASIDIYN